MSSLTSLRPREVYRARRVSARRLKRDRRRDSRRGSWNGRLALRFSDPNDRRDGTTLGEGDEEVADPRTPARASMLYRRAGGWLANSYG